MASRILHFGVDQIKQAFKRSDAVKHRAQLACEHTDRLENRASSAVQQSIATLGAPNVIRTRAADSTIPAPHTVEVLLVDDHDGWRTMVRRALQSKATVIGEAADGLESVELAEYLQPDVVLLDIEMPRMNGFEAARRILQVAPDAKIIFLTMTCDPAVIEQSMDIGAIGYVLKINAAHELVPAIDAAVHGKRFISSGAARVLRSKSPTPQ